MVKLSKWTAIVASLLVPALLPIMGHAEQVNLARHGDTISVEIGGKPFTVYKFSPAVSKAYMEPLRDAHGNIVTRQLAVGNDVPPGHRHDRGFEPHQRALYFAHGNIDGYDFWGEQAFSKYYGPSDAKDKYGRMVFRKIEEMKGGPNEGIIRATFDLEGTGQKPFAEETQEYKFSGDANTRTIDCTFIIKAGDQPVTFGDTKEGTFAVRLNPQLDSPMGKMVNSLGLRGESQVWGRRANWVDVDGVINGQELGVAIFDSPKSFRHPTWWHARGYGLLAANPFGLSYFYRNPKINGSYVLPAGQSLLFQYRVLIHEGTYKEAGVARAYLEYAAHP